MRFWGVPIPASDWVRALMPVFRSSTFNYWFITKYLGLIMILPYLSILTRNLSKRKHLFLLILMVFFMCPITSEDGGLIPFANQFGDGQTLQWFICLFLTGGYLSKYVSQPSHKGKMIVFTLTIIYFILLKMDIFTMFLLDTSNNGLMTYIGSILIFMSFRSININEDSKFANLIRWASASVLAIYLIHEQHYFSRFLYNLFRSHFLTDDLVMLNVRLCMYCFFCFGILILVDKVRDYIFQKIGINALMLKFGDYIDRKVGHWIHAN
jgi:hypothetical protein